MASSDGETEDFFVPEMTEADSPRRSPRPDAGPPPRGTGLVYDERMAEHLCLWDPEYPECPERLTKSWERCVEYGLVDRCVRIPARFAEEDEVLTLHGPSHLEMLKSTRGKTDDAELEKLCTQFDSIYIHPSTYDLALMAVGSTKDLITAVVKGEVRNGMALVRPPGHHAMGSEYCGYCFFNNVAIAADHAVKHLNVNRVLIVDWDVHHGQATQYMFYDNPKVLYLSVHRYEHGEFWPELRESNFNYVGKGEGAGYNINIPLNKVGMGNADYMAIFNNIVLPVAYEYQPELVIISSGYDAAIGCPEGHMEVTPCAYAHMLNSLMALAGGKVCVVLEGGYCISSLAEGVALTLRTLLGDPCPDLGPLGKPCDSIMDTILDVISVHRPYWKSLQFQGTFSQESTGLSPRAFHSTRREHLSKIEYRGQLGVRRPDAFPTRSAYYVHDAGTKSRFEQEIEALRKATDLGVAPHRTCLVFDQKMALHRCINERGHPEKPERILNIWKILGKRGLTDKCLLLESRPATIEELLLVHDKAYVEKMRNSQELNKPDLIKLQYTFSSVYLCADSFQSALLAAGSLLQVVDAVCSRKCRNGVAVVRPPGHHAERDMASGFCIFSNVAIAAAYALERHGLQRILVLDWDVHHGNGTQHAFYGDPRVLYMSIHRHDHGMFFPCSSDADYCAVGEGDGRGFNVNVAWNSDGLTDGDYFAAFFQVILPIAYMYSPELVLVSCGFDSCVGDCLGNCRVTAEAYGHFTHLLTSLAQGRVILALEGGYNLSKIPSAMSHCVGALLGEKPPPLRQNLTPSVSAVKSILHTVEAHKQFWSCLRFDADLPTEELLISKGIIKVEEEGAVKQVTGCPSSQSIQSSRSEVETGAAALPTDNGEAGLPISAAGLVLEDMDAPYCVQPEPWCPHLSDLPPLPPSGLCDPHDPCLVCGVRQEVWACLHCFEAYCSRYVNGHMVQHHEESNHNMVLSYSDLSVWCYPCNAYVSNAVLQPAKEDAYLKKFGTLDYV